MNLETCTRKQLVMEFRSMQQKFAAAELTLSKMRKILIPKYEEATRNDAVLIKTLEADLEFHPRAAKLMHKQKNFVVVACDEPYFFNVYSMIRNHELSKGTWTEEDEAKFLKIVPEVLGKVDDGKTVG
jgi:hypothetical protein